jgi:DNA (cytosine-5)-methyltransferase 1
VAWGPLGWDAAGFSEIEPFPCSVLAHHYPAVRNYGDLTKYKDWSIDGNSVDLICGGTPCQSFSVAGLRKGMDDPRGNLALVFLGLVDRLRPAWVVWENVPGVLSSGKGRDFGTFLGALGVLGYGTAYRVFDAQYFGLAQRRKRVFVVGYLGDWRPPCAVLLERESLSGHPAPRRSQGQGNSGSAAGGTGVSGRERLIGGFDYENNSHGSDDVTGPLLKGSLSGGGHPLPAVAFAQNTRDEVRIIGGDGKIAGTLASSGGMKQTNYIAQPYEVANRLTRRMHKGINTTLDEEQTPVLCQTHAIGRNSGQENAVVGVGIGGTDVGYSLRANPSHSGDKGDGGVNCNMAVSGTSVRRLTPRECERLMGFPDDYTLVPHRGKPACDGPRYKALGNSWAVPVAAWIGRRIQMVDSIHPGRDRS